MEIKGTVTLVGEMTTGTGKNGEWAKQDFVLESGDKYPKKVCMTLWGRENIEKYDLVVGMVVTAFIELESREYNGKWYTNVKAWKVTWEEQRRAEPVEQKVELENRAPEWPTEVKGDGNTDDLPF